MKKIFFLIALISIAQLHSFANISVRPLPVSYIGEYIYKSVDFNVSIAFPLVFEESLEDTEVEGKIQKSVEVVGNDSSGTYLLLITKHVMDLEDHLNLAIESMDEFATTLQSEIKSQKSFTYKSHEGKEALLYLEKQKYYVHYRVILIGNFQYQTVVITQNQQKSEKIDNFLNSFKTLD